MRGSELGRAVGVFRDLLAVKNIPRCGSVVLERERSELARITITSAAKRNALCGHSLLDLAAAVLDLEARPEGTRALILQGHGETFCAGLDFRTAVSLDTQEEGLAMFDVASRTLDLLRDLPLVSVAAIEGAAVGGGAELATCCDWRVMRSEAKVQFVQTRMGISPGWGGARRLSDIVGRRWALRLLARGEAVQGDEALSIGLADRVCEGSESAPEAALDLLQPLLDAPFGSAIRAVKQAVTGSDLSRPAEDRERAAFASVWASAENKAALRAQLDKRTAVRT